MSTVRAPRLRSACLFFCILALVACAGSIKSSYDSDPDVDFSGYKTFAWISEDPIIERRAGESGGRYVSPIDEQRIRQAVESELAKKGYRLAELVNAGLVVSFEIGSREKTRVEPGAAGGTVHTRRHGTVYSEQAVTVTTFLEGTLTLKFYDRVSKQAVWVGWGSKRLSESDDSGEVINKAVAQILKPFPSRIGSDS